VRLRDQAVQMRLQHGADLGLHVRKLGPTFSKSTARNAGVHSQCDATWYTGELPSQY
jgi:hypothetical protein